MGEREGAGGNSGGAEAEAGERSGTAGRLATRGTVETVLIPMTNRSGQNLRYTACLSTQVGSFRRLEYSHRF